MNTAHIVIERGQIAPTVLLPGDPLRAKYIAENFLHDVLQVNSVRNMLGFTGTYRGVPISVMGAGMGIPSASIYVHELATSFSVKRIIRIGSCGTAHDEIGVGEMILAMGASTDSQVNRLRFGGYDLAALCCPQLLQHALSSAKEANIPLHVGNVFSTDLFYHPDAQLVEKLQRFNILGVEMEAAGLYPIAAQQRISALTLLTVSDHLTRKEHWPAQRREQGMDALIELALSAALRAAAQD